MEKFEKEAFFCSLWRNELWYFRQIHFALGYSVHQFWIHWAASCRFAPDRNSLPSVNAGRNQKHLELLPWWSTFVNNCFFVFVPQLLHIRIFTCSCHPGDRHSSSMIYVSSFFVFVLLLLHIGRVLPPVRRSALQLDDHHADDRDHQSPPTIERLLSIWSAICQASQSDAGSEYVLIGVCATIRRMNKTFLKQFPPKPSIVK